MWKVLASNLPIWAAVAVALVVAAGWFLWRGGPSLLELWKYWDERRR